MLTRIEAISQQGSLLVLSLEDLENGILLEEVGGLDPVKATITSSAFAQIDGSNYQASRREERNITLKLTLEPDYVEGQTVRQLRRLLYTYFMPKSAIKLRFISDDMETVYLDGRIESFETPLFASEAEVNISIICFNPDFYNPLSVYIDGFTTAADSGLLVNYPGDVESGVLFRLFVDRALTSFSIKVDTPDGETQQLDFNSSLIADDIMFINTVPGNKYANVRRDGYGSGRLYGVSPQSQWVMLMPGDNLVTVYAEGTPIPYILGYNTKYGGL